MLTYAIYQVEAFEQSQKYKEGKFILEKAKMVFESGTSKRDKPPLPPL
jgi:hypothetical protein